jgi:hypothetical protein
MKHARKDYNRIQDLVEVIQYLREKVDGDNVASAQVDVLEEVLEERYGPIKGIAAIPLDEPVFLLRPKDDVSPTVVQVWATLAQGVGADCRMVRTATNHANQMAEYQLLYGRKIPDMPEDA